MFLAVFIVLQMSELKGYLVNYIMDEHFLIRKLRERTSAQSLRSLRHAGGQTDFFSNDYLGIAKNGLIEKLLAGTTNAHGSTGSRLLAGNFPLMEEAENKIALFHDAPSALIFNSGYDANSGLLSCVAQKGDLILYDKLSHASLRDGIRLSFADSFSFAHNDLQILEEKLQRKKGNCFVVTESVFSMDGDLAPLNEMAGLCEKYGAHLIVDEAHATGVIGELGEGAVQSLGLQHRCFARIHTFGKALGCHGAVVLGSEALRNFLINFCRPFIYSTALPPVAVAAILASYRIFPEMKKERALLTRIISHFNHSEFKKSFTPIQCFVVPGNEEVKRLAQHLLEQNLDVRPILYPTVPLGEERLRIALHSFNSVEETDKLISFLLNL
jgi:8-amino-7-oxononanoate synthase